MEGYEPNMTGCGPGGGGGGDLPEWLASPVVEKIGCFVISAVIWAIGLAAWASMLGAAGFFILLIVRAIFG